MRAIRKEVRRVQKGRNSEMRERPSATDDHTVHRLRKNVMNTRVLIFRIVVGAKFVLLGVASQLSTKIEERIQKAKGAAPLLHSIIVSSVMNQEKPAFQYLS